MSNQLNINVESMARVELVTVNGRVDSSSATELEQAMNTIIARKAYNIVLELSGVEYMSSAGLRVLISTLRTCKTKRGDVRLAAVSERVDEVLELAGIKAMFSVYDNATTAVGSF
jgi:anti-sigma B factor antagonist